jgi:O-antigen/teichoic acid export membrane protein
MNKGLVTSLTNFTSKIMQILVMIFSVYQASKYNSAQQIGAMLSIMGMVGILTFLDFGIPYNLIDQLSHQKKNSEIAKIISNGLIASISLSTIVSIVLIFAYLIYTQFFQVNLNEDIDLLEINRSIFVYIFIFGFFLIASSIEKIYLSFGLGYKIYLASIVASLISLILIKFTTDSRLGISFLIISTFGAQTLSTLALATADFRKKIIVLEKINICRISSIIKKQIYDGSNYLIITLGNLAAFGIDVYLILYLLGINQATQYVLAQRLFQIIIIPLTSLNLPLWSEFAMAHREKDHLKLRNKLLKIIKISIVLFLISAILIALYGTKIINVWTSGLILVPASFLSLYALRAMSEVISNLALNYLGGIQQTHIKLKFNYFILIVMLPIKIIILHLYGLEFMIFIFSAIYSLLLTYLIIRSNKINQFSKP